MNLDEALAEMLEYDKKRDDRRMAVYLWLRTQPDLDKVFDAKELRKLIAFVTDLSDRHLIRMIVRYQQWAEQKSN